MNKIEEFKIKELPEDLMVEGRKQDYREHLINTIDMLIDSGISVYDIDVVNKKAIRSNYILKQKVKDLIENETINISGFECIAVEDLEELLMEQKSFGV